MTGRRRAEKPAFSEAKCGCGSAVVAVQIADQAVMVDRGVDPDGEISGVKIGGRWVFTEARTSTSAPSVRYRRHRCPRTAQADMRRAAGKTDVEGPCRGGCGTRLPCVYGPDAVTLCPACRERVDRRRAGAQPTRSG